MSANNSEYTIRLMNESDIYCALLVFASHGYVDSQASISIFFECDRNAFYVAVRNSDQKIIGVCVSPITSHSTGFFGNYAVLKEYQRKGIGLKLFDSCLKHIGERNAGLFAAKNMELNYANKGFRVKGKAMVVYEGEPQNIETLNETIDKNLTIIQFNDGNTELLNKVILYDTKVQNYSRGKLITLTLQNSKYYTLIATDSKSNVLGFGCVRTNINDQKMIGPVYADNDSIAEALIIRLIIEYKLAKDNHLYLFTLNTSIGCINLSNKLQLKENHRSNELYTKFVPQVNHQYIYCIHSPSFSL